MAFDRFPLPGARVEQVAHHRHQQSLERPFDFSTTTPLTAAKLGEADTIFNQMINHCEPLQSRSPYKKVTLVRLSYEKSRSKDTFLRQFFGFVDDGTPPTFDHGLARFSGFGSETPPPLEKKAQEAIDEFADYLFQNFFLPMKAAGSKTPQPTPTASSVPSPGNVVDTPARLSTLRRDCLIRDHNRCVVTRAFNLSEAVAREERDPVSPKDDDDQPLAFRPGKLAGLEAAHIIPHSIVTAKNVDGQLQLSESKKTALSILNMFDPGAIDLIEGPNIDRTTNAITLTRDVHARFGLFRISFEAMDDSSHPKHTYTIHSSNQSLSSVFNLPVTRTLLLSPNHTIDPPSAELLAIHRAIAIILQLSAAGEYIEKIIRDMEELSVRSDGSLELGRIVSLRMGGWLDCVAAR